MIRPIAILLIALSVVVPLQAQQAFTRLEPTPKELEASLRTDWYGVYLQGKKIGYFRSTREKVDSGIRESIDLKLKLLSFGQKAEMNIAQALVFEPKAPFRLLKGEYRESAGPMGTEFIVTRTGPEAFEVVQTVGNNVRKKATGNIDYTLEDAMASELWIKRGPMKGAQIVARDLELKEQKVDSQKNTILGAKTSLVGGVEVKFYEVETVSNHDQITVLSRHNDQGKLLSGKIAIFELRAETEEQAKNAEYSKDLFVLGMAKVERPLGNLKNVKELVLEVEAPAGAFVDGPRQAFVMKGDKGQLLLGKRYGKEAKATADDLKENLKETSAYDLSDPKVKALAARAAGDAKSDEEKVKNIAKFVHDFIHPQLGNTIPTIHDLIDRKVGDCKSYALLFTTLARANGIPSREVAGLVYAGDDTKAFGGHAWNEVVLNGVWVPIDASLNETEVNATHLCMGTDKTAAKNMLQTIGTLKLRVVEMNGK